MRQPDLVLKCDGTGCIALPHKAPKVFVPGKFATGQPAYGQPAVTLAFPHLSYCHACWERDMRLDMLLTDRVKARIEERGRKIWPQWVTADFDCALIQPVDVFSPEYGMYMQRIGLKVDGLGYSFHKDFHRMAPGG